MFPTRPPDIAFWFEDGQYMAKVRHGTSLEDLILASFDLNARALELHAASEPIASGKTEE